MHTVTITFPDGTKKEFPEGSTPLDVAKSVSEGLARNALAAIVDGKPVDIDRKLMRDATVRILTARDPEGLEVLRHSCAHLLAQAVKRLYPGALQAIGPVIEHGFMFDFGDLDIGEDALPAIEDEMRKIAKERYPTARHDYASAADAKADFPGNPYKLELIEEHAAQGLARYGQGEYFDLCRGPHVPHTGFLEAFKLTKVTKAYWRGDARNTQLTRIYGLCFAKKAELEEYLQLLEQAQLRDHRRLGRELGLLMFHEYSPGAPFFLPKGAIVYNELLRFLREEYARRGYTEVITPLLYDKALWETSGHWEHYRENMFLTSVEGREFSLKPMNCPSHCLVYANEGHSYRDLPLRIADFAPLHRNELSGTLSGLTRVRKFSTDDGHIFCAPEQLQDELRAVLEFVDYVYSDVFRMEYRVELSTRPEKYLGEIALWDRAEAALADVLKDLAIEYKVNPGDGAFYGPKIDIHLKDALGRSFQCATVQVDFQLPLRFGLTYEGADGGKHAPVMIHRAIFGSVERFFGVLIEHLAGRFPLWLSPEQARILPIADRHNGYAQIVLGKLRAAGIRATLDDRKLTTNKKVREGELDKVNYLLVIGDREVESRTVNVRTRDNAVLGEKDADAFAQELAEEIAQKR